MSWLLFTQESLVLPRTINSSFLVVFSYNRIYSVISFAANTFYSQFRNGHYKSRKCNSFFFFLVFLPFLGPFPRYMEVPRLGV